LFVTLSVLPDFAFAAPEKAKAGKEAKKRPGRYKLGPVYLTPKLELRNAGLQTNVYNSQTVAIPDASVVLRPSLAGVMPAGYRLRVTGQGYLDLNHFRREQSERSADFLYSDGTHEQAFTRESLRQLVTTLGFARVECSEHEPVVRGAAGAPRWLSWNVFRSILRPYIAAEAGIAGREWGFSQNFLAVGREP